ncbi:hypothetical protein ACP275_09G064800 [Erythranthe tilingii]
MWMMGYNDGVEFNTISQDSFNGRNIPLVRTTACSRISGTDLLTLNHNLAMGGGGDQNKRELNNGGTTKQQVVVSTRWNPTLEQIQTLEELYRRGTRTPSAEEIQHITAQLRRYGKIEGKNVFYWFQNHKARERQKRRRQLDHDQVVDEPPTHNYSTQTHHHVQNKESSSPEENGTVIFEVEESKNWASPANSISTILAEKNVATQGAEAAADAEYKSDGWLQFDHAERNATWHIISSPYPPVATSMEPCILENFDHSAAAAAAAGGGGDAQTLQLFPLGSGGCEDDKEEEEESGSAAMNDIRDDVIPYQFFEFLPLKN